jgi:hypothetical protein
MQVNELFEQDPLAFPLLSGSGESTLEYFSRLSLVPLPSVRPGTTSTRAIVGPNLSQGSLIFSALWITYSVSLTPPNPHVTPYITHRKARQEAFLRSFQSHTVTTKRQSVFSQLRRTNDTYSKLEGIT